MTTPRPLYAGPVATGCADQPVGEQGSSAGATCRNAANPVTEGATSAREQAGYSQRFGLAYVDFADGQRRRIKDSGHWFAGVARRNALS